VADQRTGGKQAAQRDPEICVHDDKEAAQQLHEGLAAGQDHRYRGRPKKDVKLGGLESAAVPLARTPELFGKPPAVVDWNSLNE
jgi:hypothetical protein